MNPWGQILHSLTILHSIMVRQVIPANLYIISLQFHVIEKLGLVAKPCSEASPVS